MMSDFQRLLNEQIGHEYSASQQYVAIAVWYDRQALPRLAAHFYRQAVEERNHAMMIVQFLTDTDRDVIVSGADAPLNSFGDHVEPVALALDQEKRVTAQINALTAAARSESDFQGEQFLQWFLKEQVEEVASMSNLLTVCERAANPLMVEDHLARESTPETADPTAPAAAGGAL